jgi:hypothetical protein
LAFSWPKIFSIAKSTKFTAFFYRPARQLTAGKKAALGKTPLVRKKEINFANLVSPAKMKTELISIIE